MQSEPAIENQAAARGRRRKSGKGSEEGPVFVDNSGRRSKMLRRLGVLVGIGCLCYAGVLGMAFMGWGTSLTPSQLLPFGGGGPGAGQNGFRGGPQGGIGNPPAQPTGTPPSGVPTGAAPSGAPVPTATATATASASASAN